MAGDRVDVLESTLASLLHGRSDNPIPETGILSEFKHHGLSSRFGQKRADVNHQRMDPIIVGAPWAAASAAVAGAGRVGVSVAS